VLFGSSIVQLSYINEGWGAILAHIYARKVFFFHFFSFLLMENIFLWTIQMIEQQHGSEFI
jgi:hypothetical protein